MFDGAKIARACSPFNSLTILRASVLETKQMPGAAELISAIVFLFGTDHPFGNNLLRVSETVDFTDFTGFHPLAVVDSTFLSRIELFFCCFCTFRAAVGFDGTGETVGIKADNDPDRSNSDNCGISFRSSDEKPEPPPEERRSNEGAARRERD